MDQFPINPEDDHLYKFGFGLTYWKIYNDLRLGIDLGGTKIEAILIDEHSKLLKRASPTKEKKAMMLFLAESLNLQNR